MTVSTHKARRWLAEISAWMPAYDLAAHTSTGIHSTRAGGNGGGAGNSDLSSHIVRVLDNTDDGPTGIRTSAGALEILQSWADSISQDRKEPRPLNPIVYLHNTIDWAREHADWEALTDTIREVRTHLAQATGHADVHIGTCPKCGDNITTTPDEDGIPEWGTCTGCDTWYADQDDIIRQARQAREQYLRATLDPGVWVTRNEAIQAHPKLNAETLKKWAQRGHIRHDRRGYNMSDINRRVLGLSATLSP